eukprot:3936197-Rhodomonas_salina.1
MSCEWDNNNNNARSASSSSAALRRAAAAAAAAQQRASAVEHAADAGMQPGVGAGEGVYEEGSPSTGSTEAELHIQQLKLLQCSSVQQQCSSVQQQCSSVQQQLCKQVMAGMQPGVGN